MVGGFVARHLAAFSEAELAEIEAVLELPDVDLADWLSGRRGAAARCADADAGADGGGMRESGRRGARGVAADLNDMVDARPAHGLAVHGAPEGFDALLLARRRAETDAPVLHVCRDDARMARVAEALGFFAPDVEVLRFPAWDCLPYDRVSPNPEIVAERVATLTRLLERGARPRVLITTVNALVQKVPPRGELRGLHDGAEARRPGGAGAAGRLPGGQWLQPHRHGDGAGRVRAARRHRGPVPGRRARSGAARPLRRRDRGHAPLRHRHAAERRGAGPAVAAAGGRGVPRRRIDLPLPDRVARAVRRRGGRGPALRLGQRRAAASGRGALGGAVPRADGDPAGLPAGGVRVARLPGGGRAGGAAGDDRRPLRGAPRSGPRA